MNKRKCLISLHGLPEFGWAADASKGSCWERSGGPAEETVGVEVFAAVEVEVEVSVEKISIISKHNGSVAINRQI